MSNLTKYILKDLISTSLLGLIFFLLIIQLVSFISNVASVLGDNVSGLMMVRIFIDTIPSITFIAFPTSVIVASFITFGRLSSDSEIVAMQSLGASHNIFLKPLAIFGMLAFGVFFIIQVFLVPLVGKDLNKVFSSSTNEISLNSVPAQQIYPLIPSVFIYAKDSQGEGVFRNFTLFINNISISSNEGQLQLKSKVINAQLNKTVFFTPLEQNSFLQIKSDSLQLIKNILIRNNNNPFLQEEAYSGITNLILKFNSSIDAKIELGKRLSFAIAIFLLPFLGYFYGIFSARGGRMSGTLIGLGVMVIYYIMYVLFFSIALSNEEQSFYIMLLPSLLLLFFNLYSYLRVFRQ